MEVFTGDSNRTTNFSPEKIELELKDIHPKSPDEVLTDNLKNSPLPYTAAAAAQLTCRRKIVQKIQRSIQKVKKKKFSRPELEHLKLQLDNVDISTNAFIHTTSELIPIESKIYHPTLGIITTPHPDIRQAEELVEFQLGTGAHRHIRSWKRRLRGTIVTSVGGKPI